MLANVRGISACKGDFFEQVWWSLAARVRLGSATRRPGLKSHREGAATGHGFPYDRLRSRVARALPILSPGIPTS